MNKILDFFKKPAIKQIIASILCILCGFLVGIIVMLFITLTNDKLDMSNFFNGIKYLFSGPFSSQSVSIIKKNTGNMIFYTVPLIMCGLSVAIAYKTGLFNIGAPGQYIMGTIGALMVALHIDCTGNRFAGIMVWILAIIVGTLLGVLWGAIPGIFKALFNINEVVVCIMTNWIAANLLTWIFQEQQSIINIAGGKSAYLLKPSVFNTQTPTFGLEKLFPDSYIDGSIIIAIIIAVLFFIIMNKTKLGFELKACGANKHASKYAGMDEKKNIILSMAIAGGLAAMGGCFYYLNAGIELQYGVVYSKLPDYGFTGISSALLANCNPIGTVFSSLFLRYISAAGSRMQLAGYNKYIADVISSVIIYFAGFSRLFISLLDFKKKNKDKAEELASDSKKENLIETAAETDSKGNPPEPINEGKEANE